MVLFRRVVLGLSISSLVACSGSGGSIDEKEVVNERELVLAFEESPLEPNVYNIAASDISLEHYFNPGEALRSFWTMKLGYSDGSSLATGETPLYDATVYLSNDELIDADDLTLFSVECLFEEAPTNHTCGKFGSFITEYAPGNTNTFETTSIPLNKPLGLEDFSVDSTAFLNEIPKVANFIIKACLQEYPEKCDQFSIEINLL